MKYLILITLLHAFAFTENFEKIFGTDYKDAVNFIEKNEHIFDSVSNRYGNDPKSIKAIVFPELIRYSIIRDYLEIGSLEIVYVNTGKIDFSVGTFQIKPSFIEDIEGYLNQYDDLKLKYTEILEYNSKRQVDIRKERLMRLKNIEYQLTYLNLFYDIMEKWYPRIFRSLNEKYKIQFLSTAYNHGFDAPGKEIKKFMEKKFFPYGKNMNRVRYNYADISWYYFQNEKNISP